MAHFNMDTSCLICRNNMSYPPYQRPICPRHGGPSAPGHYPPTPPSCYPSGSYPPQPPVNPAWQAPTNHIAWVDAILNNGLPFGAIRGGTDVDGHPIYVGRAFHEGDWLPAKVIPGKRSCYVSYNGKEHLKHSFQMLTASNTQWVSSSGGRIALNAIEGGKTATGEKLYIGRVLHNGSQTVGKIHPSHRTCYIPFDGKEIAYPHYEVLISRRS